MVNTDDSSGAELSGLTPDNVKVTVDGKPASVRSVELAASQNLPLDVLFVFDVSGSMQGEPILRAKDAGKGFMKGLAPADRVAVLAFADNVRVVQDYTTDRALASRAIDSLEANGNTALYEATARAADSARASGSARRAVIFLSDGAQDGVPLTTQRDQAIAAADGADTPFFVVGEGRDLDREFLQQLAQSSRGRYLEAPDPSQLASLYEGVGQLLRSQYVVTFDATDVKPDGSEVTISLDSAGRSASATSTFKPSAAFAPSPVTLEGVQPGELLDDVRSVTLNTSGATPLRVTFYVDGINVFETVTPPYTYTFDPANFSAGDHTLKATAQYGGKATDAVVGIRSAPPAARPPSGGPPMMPIAIGAAVGIILAIATFIFVRVRIAGREDAPDAQRVVPWATPLVRGAPPPPDLAQDDAAMAESVGEPLGLLVSRAGSDVGSEYSVGGLPVSIGSGRRCAVRVDDVDLAAEEARIWVRKGHLMVHKMTKLTTMVNEGTTGGWEILEPGDTFEVGKHTFEFRLLPEARPQGAVPDVLRDPEIAPRPAPEHVPSPPSAFRDLMPRND
ncbi:MAG: VWA domain-containing protein [Chloroflexi bacterium]|nr:VWA domain-containing protein [Chloroflexota bacterium]